MKGIGAEVNRILSGEEGERLGGLEGWAGHHCREEIGFLGLGLEPYYQRPTTGFQGIP